MKCNFLGAAIFITAGFAQKAALPPLPAPMSVPKPGPVTEGPYAPQAILAGGVVVPLYPAGSPFLKADRVREAEVYNMSGVVPGRISSIVNIHNPSIEFHPVERGLNTGAVVILVAGGGHNTLNVGGESADFVTFASTVPCGFYLGYAPAVRCCRMDHAYWIGPFISQCFM